MELFYCAGKEPGGAAWRPFGGTAEDPVFEGNFNDSSQWSQWRENWLFSP